MLRGNGRLEVVVEVDGAGEEQVVRLLDASDETLADAAEALGIRGVLVTEDLSPTLAILDNVLAAKR